MTDKRKVTEQIKALRQIFEDIEGHSERLEQEAIRAESAKGHNILNEMEEVNQGKREGER